MIPFNFSARSWGTFLGKSRISRTDNLSLWIFHRGSPPRRTQTNGAREESPDWWNGSDGRKILPVIVLIFWRKMIALSLDISISDRCISNLSVAYMQRSVRTVWSAGIVPEAAWRIDLFSDKAHKGDIHVPLIWVAVKFESWENESQRR